jgi:hypothetical protein
VHGISHITGGGFDENIPRILREGQGLEIDEGSWEILPVFRFLEKYMRTPRNHYKTIEFAWVGDFNPVMNRMIESYVCATRHKMHTTYRYLFDRTKEFHRCPRMGVKRRE